MSDASSETGAIFAALEKLPAKVSPRDVWSILRTATSADEFAVALDFAADNGLYETDFAQHLRGKPDSPAMQDVWTNPVDETEMVWIPQGMFRATEDNVPIHLDGFFLARHPVTNAQFQKFVVETNYADTNVEFGQLLEHWDTPQSFDSEIADNPVVYVSSADAHAYCKWAGLSLPHEWMWEKAARGTDARRFPWGNFQSERFVNMNSAVTSKAGEYTGTRSAYGCEDMVGNVSEWCHAIEPETLQPKQSVELISSEPVTAPLVRGGCFKRTRMESVTASHRRRLALGRRNDWVGFRPAFVPGFGFVGAQ